MFSRMKFSNDEKGVVPLYAHISMKGSLVLFIFQIITSNECSEALCIDCEVCSIQLIYRLIGVYLKYKTRF